MKICKAQKNSFGGKFDQKTVQIEAEHVKALMHWLDWGRIHEVEKWKKMKNEEKFKARVA